MSRAARLRLLGYALIIVGAALGYLVKKGVVSGDLTFMISTTSALAFMLGALLALAAILDRIRGNRSQKR